MNMIEKLERSKFGRFGIPNLMKYVIAVNIAGFLLGLFSPDFYYQYLSLDMDAVFHGQVWRLLTFVICPSMSFSSSTMMNIFWFVIWVHVYYMIGIHLERLWGTFRFNLFYFSGVLWIILANIAFYLLSTSLFGNGYLGEAMGGILGAATNLVYLNQTLFLAFALLFPDMQFLVYFVIPVKAKWLSIIYLAFTGYELFTALKAGIYYGTASYLGVGSYYGAALIVVSLINLALFMIFARVTASPREAIKQKKRKVEFQYKARPQTSKPKHRCVICGRTEKDAPDLDFRFCSKCEGNFEYCSDHLFTHEHVHHD